MKQYDIFESEGGYRVAGDIHAGGPVMRLSPWRKTRRGAEALRKKMLARQKELDAEANRIMYGD